MKADTMRGLTREELAARVKELRGEVFNLRVKHATGQLDDTSSLGRARRELARALTVQQAQRKSA